MTQTQGITSFHSTGCTTSGPICHVPEREGQQLSWCVLLKSKHRCEKLSITCERQGLDKIPSYDQTLIFILIGKIHILFYLAKQIGFLSQTGNSSWFYKEPMSPASVCLSGGVLHLSELSMQCLDLCLFLLVTWPRASIASAFIHSAPHCPLLNALNLLRYFFLTATYSCFVDEQIDWLWNLVTCPRSQDQEGQSLDLKPGRLAGELELLTPVPSVERQTGGLGSCRRPRLLGWELRDSEMVKREDLKTNFIHLTVL